MALTAIVVGAGIGGLSSAIALRQANFRVEVFESGDAMRAAGQAIGIPSNASRILLSFGMDLKSTQPCTWAGADIVKADVDPLRCLVQQTNPQDAAAPSLFVHRRDYLKALAQFAASSTTPGTPVKFRYNCAVSSLDTSTNSVVLESGESIKTDLIVCADGVRSKAHRCVIGEEKQAEFSGVTVLRFTVSTDAILQNPDTAPVLAISENDRATLYVGAHSDGPRLLRYPCREGILQNFGIYTFIDPNSDPNIVWAGRDIKDVAIELLNVINKSLAKIPEMVDDSEIYIWKVCDREPLPRLTEKSLVLVGDACHPMRPNLGQGAAQAVEDAGVLRVVMDGVTSPAEIPARLKRWEEIREMRVGSAQLLSRANFSENPWASQKDFENAKQFMQGLEVPTTTAELISYFIAGDQLEVARKACSV